MYEKKMTAGRITLTAVCLVFQLSESSKIISCMKEGKSAAQELWSLPLCTRRQSRKDVTHVSEKISNFAIWFS